ncbi:DUF4262 domain-containing protein [Microbacterium marinum]|uniref:DUF4262 domain-containing protein n=1 Tax=Microbacterium marinum TaxID=421115 RepID=UPI00384E28B3
MTTPTTADVAWLDQDDAVIADQIRRHGICLQLVGMETCSHPGCVAVASDLPFGYTIGLFGIAHPEFVIVGMGKAATAFALREAARLVLDGARFMHGEEVAVPRSDRRYIAELVPNPGDIAFGANRHYQRPKEASVPLLQLTYTDGRGRFPWDPSYAEPKRRQPRPGEWDAYDRD